MIVMMTKEARVYQNCKFHDPPQAGVLVLECSHISHIVKMLNLVKQARGQEIYQIGNVHCF